MHPANAPDTSRRSSRVPIALPVLVTALGPGPHFSEMCETLVVSAHGCALRSPAKLEAGASIHFHSKEGRQTTAHVIDCQPMNSGSNSWRLAAQLDQPDNFWALQPCPQDWLSPHDSTTWRQIRRKPSAPPAAQPARASAPALVAAAEKVQKSISEDRLNAIIAESLQPLRAELTVLQDALAKRESRRSAFDISLTHIPPEVEDKLFSRLRQDLGPQVILQARSQAEQAIANAKSAIDQSVAEGEARFREHINKELQSTSQRNQALATEVTDKLRQHLHAGLGTFEQHMLEARTRLETSAETMFNTLQHRLGEEQDAHRWEMQQLQTAITAESARVQSEVASLDARIGKLDESARRLEGDLDARLQQLASDVISRARTELEGAVDVILKELSARSSRELTTQLDDACGHLKIIQKGIESSASERLRTHVTETLAQFEQKLGDEARRSADRWRQVLAGGLNALVNTLGDQFRVDASQETEK